MVAKIFEDIEPPSKNSLPMPLSSMYRIVLLPLHVMQSYTFKYRKKF